MVVDPRLPRLRDFIASNRDERGVAESRTDKAPRAPIAAAMEPRGDWLNPAAVYNSDFG
jgi:hypothetical protein